MESQLFMLGGTIAGQKKAIGNDFRERGIVATHTDTHTDIVATQGSLAIKCSAYLLIAAYFFITIRAVLLPQLGVHA